MSLKLFFTVQLRELLLKSFKNVAVFKLSFRPWSFNSESHCPSRNPCRHTAMPLLQDNLIKWKLPCCLATGITAANTAHPLPAEAHGATLNAFCLTWEAPIVAVKTGDKTILVLSTNMADHYHNNNRPPYIHHLTHFCVLLRFDTTLQCKIKLQPEIDLK